LFFQRGGRSSRFLVLGHVIGTPAGKERSGAESVDDASNEGIQDERTG
jgi:hypothetical protein